MNYIFIGLFILIIVSTLLLVKSFKETPLIDENIDELEEYDPPTISEILYKVNLNAMTSGVDGEILSRVEKIIDELNWIDDNKSGEYATGDLDYKFRKIASEDFPLLVENFTKLSESNRSSKKRSLLGKLNLLDTFCGLFIEAIETGRLKDFEVSDKFIGIRI